MRTFGVAPATYWRRSRSAAERAPGELPTVATTVVVVFPPTGHTSDCGQPGRKQLLVARLPRARNLTAELNLNVLNLFDQHAVTSVYQIYSTQNLRLSESEFFAGFDPEQQAATVRKDPRFGVPNAYQSPREIRVGAKLSF